MRTLIFISLVVLVSCAQSERRFIKRDVNNVTPGGVVTHTGVLEPYPVSMMPKDIIDAFHKACPDVKEVSSSVELGGKDGNEFIAWVFRWLEPDGKLREC